MAEDASPVLHWLRRYKPVAVRMHLDNGSSKMLARPQIDRGRWTTMEAAILAMAPAVIEALNDQEEVIATKTLELEELEPVKPPPPDPAAKTDPMAALVSGLPTIVQLIVDAADASAQRHAEAYRMAFDQQLALVRVLADRLHGLEKAYQSVLMNQAAQAQNEDPNNALMAQVLGHAMSGNQAAAPPASNGAKEPKQ